MGELPDWPQIPAIGIMSFSGAPRIIILLAEAITVHLCGRGGRSTAFDYSLYIPINIFIQLEMKRTRITPCSGDQTLQGSSTSSVGETCWSS